MLGSKSSLFCSKICGTNKKVKSTRYASHLCLYWSPDTSWLAALILCCYCCLVVQFLEQKGGCFQSTLFSKDKSKFSQGLPGIIKKTIFCFFFQELTSIKEKCNKMEVSQGFLMPKDFSVIFIHFVCNVQKLKYISSSAAVVSGWP